jgi:hypothetical protein
MNAIEDPIITPELAALVKALVPTLREVIREELKAIRPLDEPWYGPSEVAAMSCGRVSAETLRKWLRYGQIDGESNGKQVCIYKSTIDELRKNKWRPIRQPDPFKMSPSEKRSRCLPSQSVAS